MAPPVSLELHECIVYWRHELNLPIADCVRLSKRSERLVYQVLQNYQMYQQPSNPLARTRGRKRTLEREDLNYLDGLLMAQPGDTGQIV